MTPREQIVPCQRCDNCRPATHTVYFSETDYLMPVCDGCAKEARALASKSLIVAPMEEK